MITHAAARLVRRLRGPAHLVGGSRDAHSDGLEGISDPMLAALAEGQRHFGQFLLLRGAGASAHGVVWVARDEESGRPVALKFLPDALARDRTVRASLKSVLERLRLLPGEEFAIARALHEDGPRAALSSELVEGNALGALREVRLNGCLDAAELLGWLEPFGAAFEKARERSGLVHGALHPWHLVLTPQGKVKVLDYAVTELLARGAAQFAKVAARRETRASLHSSPQLRGGARATRSDDVYALGATIYDLLAGAPPYETKQLDAREPLSRPMPIRERRAAHDCWGAPIPPAWDETLAACLQQNPSKRPESVGALIEALRRGLAVEVKLPAPVALAPLSEGSAAVPAPPRAASDAPRENSPHPQVRAELAAEGAGFPAANSVPSNPHDPQAVEPGELRTSEVATATLSPNRNILHPAAIGDPAAPLEERGTTPSVPPALGVTSFSNTGATLDARAQARETDPIAAVPAWSAPTGAITAPLPEVESARTLAQQRVHHRAALTALACLGIVVQAARMTSERALPPVLPEFPRAPVAELEKKSQTVAVRTPSNSAATAPVRSDEFPSPPAASHPAPQSEPESPPATSAESAAPVPDHPLPPVRLASEDRTPPLTRAEPVPSSNPPKAGERWTNTVGMPFAPIPKLPLLIAVWETRVRDFEPFAEFEGRVAGKSADQSKRNHPVVDVSYADAVRFCEWLTTTEHSAKRLKAGQHYRLPTDLEWSAAAGLPPEAGATLRDRDDPADPVFAWGAQWPPPPTAGNFRGLNASSMDGSYLEADGDAFDKTAPVGSFPPSANGLFDLAGNAAELVSDLIAPELGLHATRGGSFEDAGQRALHLRARGVGESDLRGAPHIGFRIVLDPAAAP